MSYFGLKNSVALAVIIDFFLLVFNGTSRWSNATCDTGGENTDYMVFYLQEKHLRQICFLLFKSAKWKTEKILSPNSVSPLASVKSEICQHWHSLAPFCPSPSTVSQELAECRCHSGTFFFFFPSLHSNKWVHVTVINSYIWVEHLQQPRQLVKTQTRTVHVTHGASVTSHSGGVGSWLLWKPPLCARCAGWGGLIDGCCWALQKARCAKRRCDLGPFHLGQSWAVTITRCTRVGA